MATSIADIGQAINKLYEYRERKMDRAADMMLTLALSKERMTHAKEMQEAGHEFTREENVLNRAAQKEREAIASQMVLYNQKEQDIQRLEASFDKFNISSSEATGGYKEITTSMLTNEEVDLDKIAENISYKTQYESKLTKALNVIRQQKSVLEKKTPDYWGVDKVLMAGKDQYGEPFEYNQLVEEVLQGLPESERQAAEAGLDFFYQQGGSQTERFAQAFKITEAQTEDSEASIAGSFQILQNSFLPAEDETTLKPARKRLTYTDAKTGKEVEIPEDIFGHMSIMFAQADADNFIRNLETIQQTPAGRKILNHLKTNPKLATNFANIEYHSSIIKTYEDELNRLVPEDRMQGFSQTIESMQSPEAVFNEYNKITEGLPFDRRDEIFGLIDEKFGKDMGSAYTEFMNKQYYNAIPGSPKPGESDTKMFKDEYGRSQKEKFNYDRGVWEPVEAPMTLPWEGAHVFGDDDYDWEAGTYVSKTGEHWVPGTWVGEMDDKYGKWMTKEEYNFYKAPANRKEYEPYFSDMFWEKLDIDLHGFPDEWGHKEKHDYKLRLEEWQEDSWFPTFRVGYGVYGGEDLPDDERDAYRESERKRRGNL